MDDTEEKPNVSVNQGVTAATSSSSEDSELNIFLTERHLDLSDSHTLAEDVKEMVLKKRKERYTSVKVEGESYLDSNIGNALKENSPQQMMISDIKQEPQALADLELLKTEVDLWRVILQRLPTNTLQVFLKEETLDVDRMESPLNITIQLPEELITSQYKYIETKDYIEETKFNKQDSAGKDVKSRKTEIPAKNRAGEKTVKRPYKCEKCDFSCVKEISFTIHTRKHKEDYPKRQQGQKLYKKLTDQCNTNSMLTINSKIHNRKKPHECLVCDYSCSSISDLKTHLNKHRGVRKKCKLCSFNCNKISRLQRHWRVHTGEKPYKCDLCDYRVNEKHVLRNHLLTHAQEKPFKCDLCSYQGKNQGYLTLHMKLHTKTAKSYKCEFCDYVCYYYSNLQRHIKTHTREKPYACELCDHRCSTSDSINNHIMRRHTGEKPYKCEVCDYQTVDAAQRRRHMIKHTGEKYKCKFCDYHCASPWRNVVHMRTHTGEKPYKCEVCDYRSHDTILLRRHLKTHIE